MEKTLFVVKNEEVISIVNESLYMVLPKEYDYILWLPVSKWFGNHVIFIVDRNVERLEFLDPQIYNYDREKWEAFKESIKH